MPIIPLIAPYYSLKNKGLASCRLINWQLTAYPNGPTKVQTAATPCPGATLRAVPSGASGRCRGNFVAPTGPAPDRQPRLYSVYGTDVYRWDSGVTSAEKIGSISDDGQSPVTITCNQYDIIVCDGAEIYWRSMTEEDGSEVRLLALELPEQPGITPTIKIRPTHVDCLKQRVVCNSAYNSNQWFFTDLPKKSGDLVFAAANFYTAESRADVISALGVSKDTLVLLGTRSLELWGPQANRISPFSPVGGTAVGIGTAAPYSLARSGDTSFYLGSSETGSAGIYMQEGTNSARISNPAIEETLMGFGTAAQSLAVGSAYTWAGETFYVLDFPSEGRTFVWGSGTETFHERLHHDPKTGDFSSWPYRHTVYHNGVIWAGIKDAPGLVALSPDVFEEHDGSRIYRQLITSIQWENLQELQGRNLIVDCETGTTKVLTGAGSDPLLSLETSKDGGYQYGNIVTRPVGGQGKYAQSVQFGPRGLSKKFVFRVSFSDKCSCTLHQARFDYALCGLAR